MIATPAGRAHLLAALAVLLFTAEAAFVRAIGPQVDAAMATLLRSFVQIAALVFVLRRAFPGSFRTSRPIGHVLRGAMSGVGSWAYYHVFGHLPLATATVLFFTSVLFVTMAARPVLGEIVGARRWLATLTGFIGVVIVVRPGAVAFDFSLLVAAFLAVNAAAITLATKSLTRTEPTATIMSWIAATCFVMTVPVVLLDFRLPAPREWLLMVGIGIAGTLGQYVSVTAYRLADASSIAPILYLRIVAAALVGFVVFGERLDALTIAGSLLITGAALYITVHEATAARAGGAAARRDR